MRNDEMNYKEKYNRAWSQALQKGREGFGDLELSLFFLKKVNLLKRQDLILEIGCGIGKLCDSLYDMGYHNITGIDISSSAITFGKNRFSHLNLHCMDASSLEFPSEYFDICFSFDLAEHLPDINRHFKEVSRILKPTGKYLFQTPNALLNSIIETIRGRGLGWRTAHLSLQFSWTLKKKLLDAGFAKIEFIKIPPLSNYKVRQVPKIARGIFRYIPWKSLPLFLQLGFYVIAHK